MPRTESSKDEAVPVWQIRRWNGHSGSKQATVFEGPETVAQEEFDRQKARLLLGYLELLSPSGQVAASAWVSPPVPKQQRRSRT